MSCIQILGGSREDLSCLTSLSFCRTLERSSPVRRRTRPGQRTGLHGERGLMTSELWDRGKTGYLGPEVRGQRRGLHSWLASSLLCCVFLAMCRPGGHSYAAHPRVPQSLEPHSLAETSLAPHSHTAADESCRSICSLGFPLLGKKGAGCREVPRCPATSSVL